jgi:uncharacterized protein DUF6438
LTLAAVLAGCRPSDSSAGPPNTDVSERLVASLDFNRGSPAEASVTVADSPFASLDQSGCLGTCPAYRVDVFDDGRVAYQGNGYVKVLGKASAQIAMTEVRRLRLAFDAVGFSELDAGVHLMIDGPVTILGYRTRAGMHEVGVLGAPPEIERLALAFEQIVATERWVGTEAERAELPDEFAESIARQVAAMMAADAMDPVLEYGPSRRPLDPPRDGGK